MDKKELELELEKLEGFQDPDSKLEQYRTPPELASSVLWSVYMKGEIEGKKIYDLGCGTGTLGIGAKILGAEEVVCVDVDEKAIEIAKKNAKKAGVDIEFLAIDVMEASGSADIVIQNPPFGSQVPGSDRPFIKKSLKIAPVVYSFHMGGTDRFVRRYVDNCGGVVTSSQTINFPLERTMPWHDKDIESVEVVFYRFERK